MKMSDAFKVIEKPEEFDREELEQYLKELYQEPNYQIKNIVYKEETVEAVGANIFAEEVEKGYKRRAKILIGELVEFQEMKNLHNLKYILVQFHLEKQGLLWMQCEKLLKQFVLDANVI